VIGSKHLCPLEQVETHIFRTESSSPGVGTLQVLSHFTVAHATLVVPSLEQHHGANPAETRAVLLFLRELARTDTRFLVGGVGAGVLQGADAVDPAIAEAVRAAWVAFAARTNSPMIAGEKASPGALAAQ
jgi:hypothetical protein